VIGQCDKYSLQNQLNRRDVSKVDEDDDRDDDNYDDDDDDNNNNNNKRKIF
jgi:hypothetical protein